ncbi:hypothetical protein PRZ48_009644 [Zasmidium cellare]|uniref:Uncharacterized protein n=1 Tax=Zasmidium cellare TaxID=395010 RepID=A0ABR0ECF8_ZASCE|nr:hypothetical protein PRZ48_009644 [Zasmidium cellare]
MAATNSTPTDKPRKPLKVLRLNYYHESPKLLFDLPREIRDRIWSHVLAEPTLYNKRHKPGCAFHNHMSTHQTPPARTHYNEYGTYVVPSGTIASDIKRCRKLCVRRQGFGLLKGVNKQIQHEATSIFYETNTINFPEGVNHAQNKSLIPQVQKIPPAALQRIRHLALWQLETFAGVGMYTYTRAKLFELLHSMPQLTTLEIPSVLFDSSEQDKIFTLPNLSTLHIHALRDPSLREDDHEPVYISAGKTFSLPDCRFFPCVSKDTPSRPRPLAGWCVACQTMREEIFAWINALNRYRTRWEQWTEHAVVKLNRLVPAQPGEEAYTLHAKLGPNKEQEMRVWGLPIHTSTVRAAEARKATKRENLANLTRRPARSPVYEEDGFEMDGDFAVNGSRNLGRQRRAVEKRVDHERVLEERGNHLRNVAEKEAKTVKESVMGQGEARKVAEEEVRSERRAAGKRSGRRT